MGEFRNNISTQLSKCEEIYESIDNLLEGLERLRAHGGIAKFILYPNDGHMCESLITEKTAEEFVKVLKTEYHDRLKSIKKELNESFENMDSLIDNHYDYVVKSMKEDL